MSYADSTTLYVTKPCIACGMAEVIPLSTAPFVAWKKGALVQDAFPYMDRGQREQLITGTHPTCWGKLFGPDTEE